MDKIEKKFNEELFERIGSVKSNAFKRDKIEIYDAVINTIRSLKNDEIFNDCLTLIKPKISRVTLKVDKQKNFIFCGCFMLRGKKIILLEKLETIGTHYLEDSIICRRLENYKIGYRLGLKKDSSGKIEIAVPFETSRNLFDD